MTNDDLFEKAKKQYYVTVPIVSQHDADNALRAAIDCVVEECISVAKGCPAWTGTWVAEELMKLKSTQVPK